MVNAEDLHERGRARVVDILVLLVMGNSQAPGRAAHGVQHGLGGDDLRRHGSRGQADARCDLSGIGVRNVSLGQGHVA